MVIKLPIGVRDRHLLLARFSKNQVYVQDSRPGQIAEITLVAYSRYMLMRLIECKIKASKSFL